ncbi:MAG: hypothetical protein V1908_02065 [Candidatus Peregrinibacteria bacterium]
MLQALSVAEAFVAEHGTSYDYENLAQMTESLRTVVTQWGSQLSAAKPEQSIVLPDGFALALEQLRALQDEKMVLGTTTQFSDADLSGKRAKKFALLPQTSPKNNKLYDLVVVANLANGSTLSSAPVRFGLDDAMRVSKPRPRSIGKVTIPDDSPALSHLWIGNVRADSLKDGVELEVDQSRPVVSGDTEFSSQVFAVWNSIVLASSVISDSEEGAFSIQAPKDLEPDVGHRVTLFAVKADASGMQARSDSVNVFFRVKPAATGSSAALWALGILFALSFFVVLLRRKAKKEQLPLALEPVATDSAQETITAEEAAKVFEAQMPAPAPTSSAFTPSPMVSEIEKEFDEAFKTAGTPESSEYYEHLEDAAREQQTKSQKMPL